MAVGLRGVFLACKRAVEQMLTQEPVGDARGRIITISSQHGMVGRPATSRTRPPRAGSST